MSRDPLDDLLDATERACEGDAAQRLGRTYARRRRAARGTRVAMTVATVAGAGLLAMLAWRGDLWNGAPMAKVAVPATLAEHDQTNAGPAMVAERASVATTARAPTLAERVALEGAVRAKRAGAGTPTTRRGGPAAPPLPPKVEVAAVPAADWAAMRSPRVEERLAAARKIGRAADGTTVRALIEMSAEPRGRREAVAALVACPRPEARAFLRSDGARPLAGIARTFEGDRPSDAATRSGV